MTYRSAIHALFAALLLALFVAAQAADDPADLESLEQKAFRAAADRVADSVVRIETVGGLERVSKVLFGTGPTTGLVIDKDGYIISSAFNFVNKPASILVRLPDGSRKPAELVATDHNRMLVLLQVRVDKPLPVPDIAPDKDLRVGQWTIAVGRTFESEKANLTIGVVSALGRIWGKAIQTDAILSPNNYGGPLVDVRGRVMGVIVPLSPEAAGEVAGVEWYDSGIGFAVPAEFIQSILPRLKKGDLFPGVMGISLSGNMQVGDATLGPVPPNSPAAEAGLKAGDKVVEIDGRAVKRAADVKREIARRYAGDKLRLVVLRGKERIEREIELVQKLEPFQHAFLGILPMRDSGKEGTPVRYVYPNSPAAAAGIKPGDVITGAGGKSLKGRNELREELGGRKIDDEVELQVKQGDKTNTLKAKLAALPDALPPETLPAARAKRDYTGERPPVGRVALTVPEMKNESAAYVPEDYDPDVPYSLLVWLHGEGGFDQDKLLTQIKPICDKHGLIFVAPKAVDPQKWAPGDLSFIQKLIEQVTSTYDVDAMRVAVFGQEAGGAMAWMVAARNRETVRTIALVDAPAAARPPEGDPLNRFAVYFFTAAKSGKARQVEQTIKALRERKTPVTVKSLGDEVRAPADAELDELARWIDMLDRI